MRTLFLITALIGNADVLESDRSFLKKAGDPWIIHQTFEYPYLYSIVAISVPKKIDVVAAKVKEVLEEGKLAPGSKITLPASVTKGEQLEAIQGCGVSKCQMKLHSEAEKRLVEKAPLKEKVSVFAKIVEDRMQQFSKTHKLLGYEEREENVSAVKKMLEGLTFFPKVSPQFFKYLHDDFWTMGKAPAFIDGSFERQEVVQIAPDRLQPIWRLGHVLSAKERHPIFFELHIYSTHYFDSSIRILEVIPQGEASLLVLTDVLEIDELTKSGLIRLLYMGKMKDAVLVGEKEILEKVL